MKNTILSITFSLICLFAHNQISVTNQTNATTLAQNISGSNITISNASILGAPLQSGLFSYSGTNLETLSGVILSTGDVQSAVGPNNLTNTSSVMGQPGDASLSSLSGYTTNDRVELKFDFQVQSDYIEFSYIFASEEYNEFVNSSFNDVFAFYISGPGIVGEQNLAVVPTTTTPVTINSINSGSFWQFFRSNVAGALTNDFQFDGYTTKMKASKSGLIPCNTYTLRLVIADGSDAIYDSWVLLEENSLVQGNVSAITNTPTVDSTALEGCIQASFTFQLNQALSYNTDISYEIQGTAINGVDYQAIDNQITIPAGQTSATIYIDAINDGLTEGQESILLLYSPTSCAPIDTIQLFINDAQPIDYTLNGTDLSCFENLSGQIDATITGGTQPYLLTVIDPNNNEFSVSSTSLPITGLEAGTYTVDIDDVYGCDGDAQVIGAEYNAGQTFLPDGNGNVYTSTLNIQGFGSATFTDPSQLQSICLNMEHSALGEVQIRLIAPNGTELILKERFNNSDGGHTDLGEPVANGPVDGGNSDITPGIGFDYCFTNNPVYGTMVDEQSNFSHTYTDVTGNNLTDNFLPSGSYTPYQDFSQLIGTPLDGNWTIWVKDHNPQDNGYIFNWNISFTSVNAGNVVVLNQPLPNTIANTITNPACGASTGGVNISVAGPNSPFTFLWSNGATTEDIAGVPAGVYSVAVTNALNCQTDTSFTISNATGSIITGVVTNETCVNSNNGSIDITVTGTVQSILWSNGSTNEDLSNLAPGNYTVNVTNTSGCLTIMTFVIQEALPLNVSGIILNEYCGNMEGEIDLSVSGGSGPYSYVWSNGQNAQDLSDLIQNNYSVWVTDGLGCIDSANFSITNLVGQCVPNCDLEISNSTIIHEICGDTNGSINLSVFSSNSPVSYQWNTGAITNSISNLQAGNYSVNLYDALGCTVSQSFSILNNAGSLLISNPLVTPEDCGNNNGAINISVSGGSGPYTYSWSNAATTQDVYGLNEGVYSVTVSDQLGCQVNASFTVGNNTNTMALTFQYVMNEVCNNNLGSIDINLTAGTYTYLWSNGATTQDLTGLSSGNYSCTINNAGCLLNTPVYTVLNESGNLQISVVDFDHEYCNLNNGEIQVASSGGVQPVTLLWSNGSTLASLTGLNEGTYTCTATSSNGCSVSTPPIVLYNTAGDLNVTSAVVDELCSNGLGSIDLSVSGGVNPIIYSWSNGSSLQDLSNLSNGSYTYAVTDVNQCSTSSTLFVANGSGSLVLNNSIITQPNCGINNGAINISVTGSGTLNYLWSNGATSEDLTNITAGIYSVTITDASGCSLTHSFNVIGKLTLSSALITNDICSSQIGSINISVSGGSLLTYNWSNGSIAEDISNLFSGNYQLTVTSFEGCQLDTSFTINNTLGCFVMCSNSSSNLNSGFLYDSGNFAGSYLNNQNCSFLIQPACADSIILTFSNFSTQFGNDFIRIYDGTNALAPLIGTYSGTSLPPTVVGSSGSMFITFISNGSITSSGFSAAWNSSVLLTNPNSDFLISNSNPPLNTTVNFTNNDINGTSWQWDMNGDGVTDYSTQNVDHVFTVPGTYNVSLTATNCFGSTTTIHTIIVQGAPSISLNPAGSSSVTFSACGSSVTHTFTIINSGTGDLIWSGTNGSFALSPSSGTVTAGSSQIVSFTVPCYEVIGTYSINSIISSNDISQPTITNTLIVTQTVDCLYKMCLNTGSTDQNGILSDSGGSTGNYSNSQDCGFLIQPTCSEAVTLSFSNFNTYSSVDFVRIYDGVNLSGPILGTFSGAALPPTVTANSGSMYIAFHSNSTNVSSGFLASWTTTPLSIPANSNFSVSNSNPPLSSTVNLTNNDIDATAWAWDVNGDGITDYTTQNVNHIYTLPGTYVVSLTATNCIGSTTSTQTIIVQESPTISLNPGNTLMTNTMCGSSVTHTFTITNNGNGVLNWSGTNGSYPLSPASGTITPGNSQIVSMTVPSFDVAGTYTINTVISSNDISQATIIDTLIITQTVNCLFKICVNSGSTDVSGNLSDSGGINGNYSNSQNCGFLIQPACTDAISLTFSNFSTYNLDFVYVYDGVNTSGILLGTFYGSTLPPTLTANSGSMYIAFSSNASNVLPGFLASWTSIPITVAANSNFSISNSNPPLNSTVNLTNTDLNASTWAWDVNGDGITDYTTQNVNHTYNIPGTYVVSLTATNCFGSTTSTQTITVQGAPIISLNPTGSTVITNSTCGSSVTHTFTITNNGTGDLTWSGTNGIYPLSPSSGTINSGNTQVVTMNVPSYENAGTYSFYSVISSNDLTQSTITDTLIINQTINCLFKMCVNSSSIDTSGNLSDSGGATGNYLNSQNCGFLIQPPCSDEVSLSFSNFSTYNSLDYVNVYDGVNTSGILLGTFYGATLPPTLIANSGSMYIVFNSNASNVSSGFLALWTSVPLTTPANSTFNVTNNPVVNTTVNFVNSDNTAIAWNWDIDNDGITDYNTQTIDHIFSTAGDYIITLTAFNCTGSTTTTETITVLGPPSIVIDPLSSSETIDDCLEILQSSFTITNTGESDLNWSATNGQFSLVPSAGVIPPNQSQVVTFDITSYINPGNYVIENVITSDDPNNPTLTSSVSIDQTIECIQNTLCSSTTSSEPNGIIFDSGGPTGNYLNNENCSYLIQPHCFEQIVLTLNDLSLQSNSDYLYFYDGTDASGILIAQLTGNTIPAPLIANSGAMFIVFTSNGSTVQSGFSAQWTSNGTTLFSPTVNQVDATCSSCPDGSINIDLISGPTNTYLWSIGATTEDVTDLLPGNYSVLITNSNGCDTTMDFTILNTSGISDLNKSDLIKIYPNPATLTTTLTWSLPIDADYTLEITNVLGQLLFSENIESSGDIQLETGNFVEGMYYIKIHSLKYDYIEKLLIGSH